MLVFWLYLHTDIDKNLFNIPKSTIIKDKNNITLYEFLSKNQEKHQELKYKDINEYFFKGLIATEDKRFFFHEGIDYISTSRALKDNFIYGRTLYGGSTITQQLAKNLYKNKSRTIENKIHEAILALQLEKNYSKQEILELYANQVSFGGVNRGIYSASTDLFNLSPKNISLNQSAFLVAILKSPTKLLKDSKKVNERKNKVLKKMYEQDYISKEQFESNTAKDIEIKTKKDQILAPHFVFFIKDKLPKQKQITSTLNYGMQEQIQKIADKHIGLIGKNHNINNYAILVAEVRTGKIRTMIGNSDYFNDDIQGKVNIINSKRQVGSTLKPFLYLLAFENLNWNKNTTIIDEPISFLSSIATPWEPKNYNLKYKGTVEIKEALSQSLNIPAVKTLDQIGQREFIGFLNSLGIQLEDDNDYGLSLALGAPNINLLELAHAYVVLARKGEDFDFLYLENQEQKPRKQIFSKEKASEIIDIMSNNTYRIDSFGEDSPLNFDFFVAAKTGTTRDFRDNYCIGFNDEVLVFVWAGNANGEHMRDVSGITGAGPLFNKVMNFVADHYPKSPKNTNTDIRNIKNETLMITKPINNSEFIIKKGDKIKLEANQKTNWYINDKLISVESEEIFYEFTKGIHQIKAKKDNQEATTQIRVRLE
ncbi:MAG: penicillin-binding protein 1C [Candidatus Gracilibacteria bacterium]|nr:penicillin-binding protein 1C [Candidatus Gracilibacteria bacterium]